MLVLTRKKREGIVIGEGTQEGLCRFFRRAYLEGTAVDYKLPQWYVSARKKIAHNFTAENFKGVVGRFPSPCGDYTFVIEKYQKSVGGWDYTYYRGIVYSRTSEVVGVNSSAQKFWHCWVRKDGKTYLLCNEDLHSYSIIDVKAGKIHTYVDPKARNGWGFSWKEVLPSPDGKYLAVQGDYIGAAREVALYDLSNIEAPLKKIKRLDANFNSGYLVLKEWRDGKVVMEHHQPHTEATTIEVGV